MTQPAARFDESFLKPGRPVFKVVSASDSALGAISAGLRITGPPERRFWDAEGRTSKGAHAGAGGTGVTFGLRLAPLPSYDPKVAGKPPGLPDNRGPNTLAAEAEAEAAAAAKAKAIAAAIEAGRPPPEEPIVPARPMKRPEKYYLALLKAEKLRNVTESKDRYDEQIAKDESAAARTAKRDELAAGDAKSDVSRSSSSAASTRKREEENNDADDEGDFEDEIPPLRPYDGVMKIDIEFVVLRAPGEVAKSDGGSDGPASTAAPSSTKSSESTPRMDLAAELQDLQDLIEESSESESSDGLPDGLAVAMANIYDSPDPRLALGIGGTVFFCPDAERYAFGPSLPPPPPPSLQGRRRMRIKPRLPLDISNHRYRDEHPNIWPDPPYSPDLDTLLSFESKLMTLDFFKSCNTALSQIPQQSFRHEAAKHREEMGKIIDVEIKKSLSWREYIHRERMKKKDQMKKEQAEAADAEAAAVAKAKEDRQAAIAAAKAEERDMYSGESPTSPSAPAL